MEYERVTREYQFDCSKCKDRQCTNDGFCFDETSCRIYNRLAELEDKIENGTLIELPCKVGDTIFRIEKDCSKCSFYREDSWDYNFWCTFDDEDTKNMFEIDGDKDCVYTIEEVEFLPALKLSENEFLTKAEAEKKLKELKGE